jgi:hypothetical protein
LRQAILGANAAAPAAHTIMNVLQDLLAKFDKAASSDKSNPTPAQKQWDAFMRVAVTDLINGSVDDFTAEIIAFRAQPIETALGVPPRTDGTDWALIYMTFVHSDMEYFGIANVSNAVNQDLLNAARFLVSDKQTQALKSLQTFAVDLAASGMAPDIASYLSSDSDYIVSAFVFSNSNPNASSPESVVEAGIYDAHQSGLAEGVARDVIAKLQQAGKQIAGGGTGCDALKSAMGIVQKEIAAGHVTVSQAASLMNDISLIQSLMGC